MAPAETPEQKGLKGQVQNPAANMILVVSQAPHGSEGCSKYSGKCVNPDGLTALQTAPNTAACNFLLHKVPTGAPSQ